MSGPRVLVVLGTEAAWSRGILRGFMEAAHERDWTLLHYHPSMNLNWLADEWTPAAAVIGPELGPAAIARLGSAALVSVVVSPLAVTARRSSDGARGRRHGRRQRGYLDSRPRRPAIDRNDGGSCRRRRSAVARATFSAGARPHDPGRDPSRSCRRGKALARDHARRHGGGRQAKRLYDSCPAQRRVPARVRHASRGVSPSRASRVSQPLSGRMREMRP
jgi:hypothetical protein